MVIEGKALIPTIITESVEVLVLAADRNRAMLLVPGRSDSFSVATGRHARACARLPIVNGASVQARGLYVS